MSAELAGRNALVLGVERPAGRRAAVALAEAGANVAVATLSEETAAEFAANSTANEFWALGRKSIVLTTDGHETTVLEAVADAAVELGPISILIWHAPHAIPKVAGLRSDPAVVVLLAGDHTREGNAALLDWTRDLADEGLRANALIVGRQLAAELATSLRPHEPGTSDLAGAIVHLASDASAAIEGSAVIVDA